MDRDSVAKTFWDRMSKRQYELNLTSKQVQAETLKLSGKPYRLYESKSRNSLPDTFTVCIFASILKTTTDYLLGFVEESGEITTKEKQIVDNYRSNKKFKAVVDNLLTLVP